MYEPQATNIADILGGETWQSGGDIWLVIIHRKDSHMVVISDDTICEYTSEEEFENAKAGTSILLS